MSMPLVTVHGPDDVRLDQIAQPDADADDVIVKVSLCGICGSDLGYIAMGGLGTLSPMPLGHELVGTVDIVGKHITDLRPGDRVVVNPMANSNAIDCKHNGTGTNTATIKRLNESVSLWGKLIIPRCWRSMSPAPVSYTHLTLPTNREV